MACAALTGPTPSRPSSPGAKDCTNGVSCFLWAATSPVACLIASASRVVSDLLRRGVLGETAPADSVDLIAGDEPRDRGPDGHDSAGLIQ